MALQFDTSRSSPSHSSRNGAPVSLIVLHASVGTLANTLNWLCSSVAQVSAHYVISQRGIIYQLVPDALAAWHAGKSRWGLLFSEAIRDQSIGVELENRSGMPGFKGQDPYPAAQIAALTDLTHLLIDRYRIAPSNIVRHLDIAQPVGRKTDPLGFPWDAWRATLSAPAPPPPPAPAPTTYRATHTTAIFEAPSPRGPVALGGTAEIRQGDAVEIDEVRADGWCHLSDQTGFVPFGILEKQ